MRDPAKGAARAVGIALVLGLSAAGASAAPLPKIMAGTGDRTDRTVFLVRPSTVDMEDFYEPENPPTYQHVNMGILQHLRWRSYTRTRAVATGILWDFGPSRRVTVTASRPRHGLFTQLRVKYRHGDGFGAFHVYDKSQDEWAPDRGCYCEPLSN